MAAALRVLIVEDSQDDSTLLVRELERSGFEVVWKRVETAKQMREALTSEVWDLVLSDYTMPRFSALEALKVLVSSGIDIPFILVSGTVGEDAAVAAMKAGAYDYVLKTNLKRLAPAVQREIAQAEDRRARRSAEEHYRTLVAEAPIGIYRSTRKGRFASVNAALVKLLRYDSTEELLRLDLTKDLYFGEAERERLIGQIEDAGGMISVETRLKRRDGSPVWVRLDARAVRGASGAVEYFEGFVHDIDQRKTAERALQQSIERFRRSFSVSPIGMSLSEAKSGRFIDVNERFAATLGYRREDMIGRTSLELGLWADPQDRERSVHTISESGSVREREVQMRTRDGATRHLLGSIEPLDVGEEQIFLSVFQDITERKRAEESIRRLLGAVEQAGSVIYMTDPDGSITYVNPAFERVYGYSKQDVLGKTPRILKSGSHDQAFYKAFWKRLLAGEPVREEFINKRRDGALVTVEAFVSTVFGNERKRVGFIAVQEDITERKRNEEELRTSEERYRFLFDANPQPMWVFDEKTLAFLAVNEAACRHYGYSRDDFLGMTIRDIRPPEDIPALVRRIATEPHTYQESGVWRHRRKDGSVIEVEITSNPLVFDGHDAQLVLAMDVTERRHAERRIQERTTYLNALVEHSPLAILALDTNHRIQIANPAFVRLFRYSREELSGQDPDDLITPTQSGLREEAGEFTRDILLGRAVHAATRRRRKDDTLIEVELYGVPLMDGDKVIGVYAMYEDLTQRHQLEEQLRQSQKMEAIGQLAGGVAHDFNNLLTAILGYADLLTGRVEGDELQEAVTEIRKAGERAAALTRQLLAFSRKQVLNPEVLDVNRLIENLEKMLRRLIGENIDLATRLAPKLGRVRADAGQIEQVILNLAVNARDAMPGGGKLVIETADIELDDAYAREHVAVQPGSYVMIAVSDSGMGMTAETRARIFEPFFTTKKTGTGLGLATVYGIVKQSGGNIWVYSEPGRGTTIKVYLPRLERKVQEAKPKAAGSVLAGGSERILLVEDEPSVRALARRILERYGYSVLTAGSGAEALEISGRESQPIDLLVTDLIMPGMAGPDLAAKLAASRPQMRVLFMSGYTDDAVIRDGLLPAKGLFLQKPFTPDGLARKVREALS